MRSSNPHLHKVNASKVKTKLFPQVDLSTTWSCHYEGLFLILSQSKEHQFFQKQIFAPREEYYFLKQTIDYLRGLVRLQIGLARQ